MQAFWDSIPLPLRSIINVCLGAALAAAVGYLTKVVSGDSFDPSLLLSVVATAVGTALARALNPLDGAYGAGSQSVQDAPVGDVQDPGQ